MSNKISITIVFVIFITSSFDIFLNLKIGGFSIRITLLLMGFFIIQQLFINFNALSVNIIGGKYLLLWTLFQIIFIPNTTFLIRNVSYVTWLVWYISFVIILPNFIKTEKILDIVIRYYIKSFFLMSILAVIQLTLGLIGYDFFITQWWIKGVFPRINGFSYEPSYFSTYLIIGWSFCLYLLSSNFEKEKLAKYSVTRTFWMITLAIIISTSRMGIAFMVIISLIYLIRKIPSLLIMNFRKILFITILTVIISFSFNYLVEYVEEYDFLLNGLGVAGKASDSTEGRAETATETFQVFLDNPIIGVSLGGIPSGIGKQQGTVITNQAQIKSNLEENELGFEGQNVIFEILAASGLLGFIVFVLYLVQLFTKPIILSIALKQEKQKSILLALTFSLFIVIIMLVLNQNILRPWLWIHIAIINASYSVYRKNNEIKY